MQSSRMSRTAPILFSSFAAILLCLVPESGSAPGQLSGIPQAELTALADRDSVKVGEEFQLATRVQLPEGLHVNSNQPRDPRLIPIVLTVGPTPGISVLEIVYPEATELEQAGAPEPLTVYENDFTIGVRLAVAPDLALDEVTLPASLRYQACDEQICYFPTTVASAWTLPLVGSDAQIVPLNAAVFGAIPFGTGIVPPDPVVVDNTTAGPRGDAEGIIDQLSTFTILSSTGGYLRSDDFLQFIRNAESGVEDPGRLEGRGLLAIIALVLLGGLALNLTPCVLPMIPINLAIIGAGAESGKRGRGFLLGSVYGGAMAVVYGILGLVVILTAGTFGMINASPWFNVAIAAVFVVLALAMFDVFTIDFSRFSTLLNPKGSRGSFVLAFGMGSVAALLAGACVAPVVIQVILFSGDMYASGATAALLLPFLLGAGMAIPWPIAGAGFSALPKPGAWMVRVKQAFGVIILGTAIYYGFLGYTLFADRWVDPAEVSESVERMIEEGWYPSLSEGLAQAEIEQKPVLVDLWATWCKNCLVMDQTTLRDPEVIDALSAYVKIKFQAESPDQAPVAEVMRHFGAIGLPAYVILRPGD